MLYAYKQIMRENSPVKNVVIDLSCNTGGAADAAVFVISAVLGDGSVSALNPMTGAMATAVYNVDLNLDHQYGQYDINQGAVPDFTISKYMSFYDRERLTEYIDSLL